VGQDPVHKPSLIVFSLWTPKYYVEKHIAFMKVITDTCFRNYYIKQSPIIIKNTQFYIQDAWFKI